jgi:GDP-L-fucose synthase
MEKNSKIYIAGHRGMVGSAILRKLESEGFSNFVLKNSSELDLRDQSQVSKFFRENTPEYVFVSAAKVGGILANNNYKAEFLYDNLMIQNNLVHNSYLNKVKKLLFLGSSCIYPKECSQPMKEEYLLTGKLEPTNEPYAIAKIAGIKMCDSYRDQYGCNFISAMPSNLYGPNDNYDLQNSHVIPALIRKFQEAKETDSGKVMVWGTGKPRREFLHVEDLADALYFLMLNYHEPGFINVGSGEDLTIIELAEIIKKEVGYAGNLVFDKSKPDGTMRKLLDVSRINKLGWQPKISLEEGIKSVYSEYKARLGAQSGV